MSNDEISHLIPDYLENRLSDTDRARLEAAIARDSDIAAEFKFQKNIQTALRADTANHMPDELGWVRLEKEMSKGTAHTAANLPIAVNDNPKPSPFWRYAAACLGVALLGQTVFMSTQLNKVGNEKYLPVISAPANAYTLKVEFTANAKNSDITELLKTNKANIISGPSNLGLYEISFSTEADRTDAETFFRESTELVASQGRP